MPARATNAQKQVICLESPCISCVILPDFAELLLILDQDTVWYPFEVRLRVF